MRARVASCLLACLVPLAAVQERSVEDAAARARLETAAALKRALRGTRGRVRLELRARAVEAYRRVHTLHPCAPAVGAEAAFRAGELLRADGAREAARTEFRVALELGAGTPFRARAGLELGHLFRRQGLAEEALEAYRTVLLDPASARGHRDEAALWAGRALVELERPAEARRLFERVAERGVDPVDRVIGHDELALVQLAGGDLAATAETLARCRRALGETALEETPLGQRVSRALERMRAVERLRAERARRREGVLVEG